MRFLLSSPFAAASFLAVACTSTPALTPEPTASPPPTPAPTARPTPVPTPTPVPILSSQLLSDEHVIDGAMLSPDDPDHYGATLSASYFSDGDAHHAYVVGFGPNPGDQQPFHATSADGVEWTVNAGDPLAALESAFSPPGPVPGTVLHPTDDEWVMYLWGTPSPLVNGAEIYRATAADPGGPWTVDEEPVVPLGEPGEVDDLGLDFPAVLPTDEGWFMLYGANGGDRPHTARILLATSPDGITWEKQGRVIEPQDCGGADIDFTAMPRLFADAGGGFLAFAEMGNDVFALRSNDAIDWTCQEEPVFPISMIEGGDRVHTYAAGRNPEGGINLMVESLFTSPDGVVTSNIWAAEM